MHSLFFKHLASVLVVFIAALVLVILLKPETEESELKYPILENLDYIDISNPEERAIFKEVLSKFYNEEYAIQIINHLVGLKQQEFLDLNLKEGAEKKGLSLAKFYKISFMFFKFLIVYFFVLIVLTYFSISFGILSFIRYESEEPSNFYKGLLELFSKEKVLNEKIKIVLKNWIFASGKIIIYFILFSPAFVFAYSIRTKINTDNVLFLIVAGIFTNAVLINYVNRFFNFLIIESGKGYVENAIIKGLNRNYKIDSPNGVKLSVVFSLIPKFSNHIIGSIYKNSVYQFIPSIKEQSLFIISGLIITEMALNIHGYINYEMLKFLLIGDFQPAVLIIFLIFLVVKMTEIIIDVIHEKMRKVYSNEK